MVTQNDPFESYRRHREIQIMERRFQDKAMEQRRRLETLLSESAEPEQLDGQVTREMEDFLAESTSTAEKMLEHIYEDAGQAGEAREVLSHEIRDLFREAQDEQRRRAEALEAPTGDQPAGRSLDLRAALARIRSHGRPDLPEMGSGTAGAREPESPDPAAGVDLRRRQILESFDSTYQQVSQLLGRRLEEQGIAPGEDALPWEGEAPAADPDAEAADFFNSAPAPRRRILSTGGGETPRLRSASFGKAELEERTAENRAAPAPTARTAPPAPAGDPDDEEQIPESQPDGWDLPVRPAPPGAWVVAKEKEEGAAGLANAAGDAYLLRKLCQEVRRLNRVYQLLLEKGVVTREEVEGGPAKAEASDDEDVTVADYSEERYRPIITSEKDFSLTTLVADVHRLKLLREVLVKKGVVSQKDLSK